LGYIGNRPADSYTSFAVQHFTTSATTTYTLDNPVANENEIALFINNVRQEPGSSYAYTASGTTLTLSAATSASDTMYCVFIGKAVQTVTPTLPIANFSSTGIDDNATSTAITIDGSENVFVKPTGTGTNIGIDAVSTGFYLRDGGQFRVARDNSQSIIANRLNGDGVIIDCRKDGTTVGTINAKDGDIAIGTNDTALRFSDSTASLYPFNNTTNGGRDNAVDLGLASVRWQDLYLGGNIYLGGTGSANALDDYEEGSWTPTLIQSTTNPTITYSRQLGHYTKIGRLVLLTGNMYSTSVTNGSGNVRIGGLPFVINAQDQGMEGGASIGYANGFTSTNSPQTAYCPRNNSFVNLMTNDTSDGRNNLDIPVTNTGTLIDINFTVVYMTS
jgi:hypothetical protein